MKKEYIQVFIQEGSLYRSNGEWQGYVQTGEPTDKEKKHWTYQLEIPVDELVRIEEMGVVESDQLQADNKE